MGIEATEAAFAEEMRPKTWPQIEGRFLTADDIGTWVTFLPSDPNARQERGRLSSFRASGQVFVRFKGPGGELCRPDNLRWG